MHECTVCGLLFLGGSACPSCGSLSHMELDGTEEGKETAEQRGGIPGLSELDDAMRDVIGEDELKDDEDTDEATGTSLPFTIGGGVTEEVSSLPFGVGSRSAGISDESDPGELEEADDSEQPEPEPAQTESESLPNPESEDEPEPVPEDDSDPEPEIPAAPVLEEQPSELETVPLPGSGSEEVDELDSVPLPASGSSEQVVEKPIKVQAVAIIEDDEDVIVPEQFGSDEVAASDSSVFSEAAEGHYQIQAKAVDMEELYAEPEHVVEHTFEDEELTSEVEVNLDEYPEDDVSAEAIFAPELISSEPDLFPAQALQIDTSGDSELSALLSSGFDALEQGSWDQAARSFRTMAAKRPGDASILNNYGLALLQHAIDLAEDDFNDPDAVDSQYEAAIMALKQAAKSNPEEALILYNLGTALVSSGRFEKALRIFDVVMERNDSPKVHTLNGRAAAHMGMGSFDAARIDLQLAKQRDSGNELISANLARISPT